MPRLHRRPRDLPPPQVLPMLEYQADPIRIGLDRLGRRWTLLLLRDMAFLKLSRFNQFLRNNPGLTPRVLSRRLREMEQEGLVTRSATGGSVTYRMTRRGADAVYILLALLRYGTKYHAAEPATLAVRPAG